jgi:hypothetical protein
MRGDGVNKYTSRHGMYGRLQLGGGQLNIITMDNGQNKKLEMDGRKGDESKDMKEIVHYAVRGIMCLNRTTSTVTLSVVWCVSACFRSLELAACASSTSRTRSMAIWSLTTSHN